ncbi:MAG TPA: hypothetical protein VJ596_02535 [Gemmatimonadaceae bacterium]|nr:hypothetical protein [Gemmatimonadaceae bacterium]
MVNRSSRPAQWYGYTVCLVAVITLLFSMNSFVNGVFRLTDPARGGDRFGASLSSFEAYRATADRRPMSAPGTDTGRTQSESELRAQYEVVRNDQIAQNRFEAQRTLVTSGILILFAVLLFVWHWRWLRSLTDGDSVARG